MTTPVSERSLNLTFLHDEYVTLLAEARVKPRQELAPRAELALLGALVRDADWSREAAMDLIYLAKQYGHFFLRNATALAAALEIEDGLIGY